MNNYILSCCSTVDLSLEHLKSKNISYINFHYEVNGVPYDDDLGQTMSYADFYNTMAQGATTKTSQVNAEEFEAYFTPYLEQGLDILHVSLSSGLSGVINSANIAKDILNDKFPERKIYIVDSLSASSGYGLLLDTLADLRDQGKSLDELNALANEIKNNIHHWFFSTDLSYYIKGGRVSKTEGMIGNLLNICPLLHMNQEGKLVSKAKVRSKKKVITTIVDKMIEYAKNGLEYHGQCFISHSHCYEDARSVADLIESKFPNLKNKVVIHYIGTTIGSHTGPNTVALFFHGSGRGE